MAHDEVPKMNTCEAVKHHNSGLVLEITEDLSEVINQYAGVWALLEGSLTDVLYACHH
jgi:hypothetical protein